MFWGNIAVMLKGTTWLKLRNDQTVQALQDHTRIQFARPQELNHMCLNHGCSEQLAPYAART